MTLSCIIAEVVALLGYLVAAVLFPLRLMRPELRWVSPVARGALLFGAALHGSGLLAHAFRSGGEALLGQHANISFVLILLIVAGWAGVSRGGSRPALGAFAAPVVFLLALFSLFQAQGTTPDVGPWTVAHIILNLLAYGAFGVSFVMAAAYVFDDWSLKTKKFERLSLLPPMPAAAAAAHAAVVTGFVLLTLGLGVGVANVLRLGAPLDPKIIVSLVVWAFYGVWLYLHTARGRRGRHMQLALLAGFALVLISFLALPHPVSRFWA